MTLSISNLSRAVGSSGFSGYSGVAGTGTSGYSGAAGAAGPSNTINATDDTSSTTLYPVMVAADGSNQTAKVSTTKLYFDASTGVLRVGDSDRLWVWGYNQRGQLATGDTTARSSPVQTISATLTWKQVSAGAQHMAAIKTDGTLWLWGRQADGQLGNNSNSYTGLSSPVQTVSAGTNWKQVSAGGASYAGYTTAIKTDNTLWLWGKNDYGQLGTNDTTDVSSPVQTVSSGTNWSQVSSGRHHTAAIKTDGTLWLWGRNDYGQLGNNDTINISSPVQTVSGGNTWSQVSCGGSYTAAIKTDGTLWLWGYNGASGNLGTGDTANYSSPVQTVSGGTTWIQVSCGKHFDYPTTGAIKSDGTLWMWGENQDGQLGDNTTTDTSSPIQTIAAGTNWSQISCGVAAIAAIKTDGTLWTWGQNYSGQLGTNDTIGYSSPVQTVASGTNWKQVSCSSGEDFTCAVTFRGV